MFYIKAINWLRNDLIYTQSLVAHIRALIFYVTAQGYRYICMAAYCAATFLQIHSTEFVRSRKGC